MEKTGEILSAVQIKKEVDEDGNINDFAETTMNELLGWYGYGTNREEVPEKHQTGSTSSNSHSPDATLESPKCADVCEWCGKAVDEGKGLASSASGATFCSEPCFSQSRRANFKKNKTCDWCRHVRHTISYVDFQEGASQLQFCSTKCLNQYKMHIFCRETRAHLEIHPHLQLDDSIASNANLITPELWLQNCKSPEPCASPPSPVSPKNLENHQQTSPLPLLSLAHPSKLMDNPRLAGRPKPLKKLRKRRRSTTTTTTTSSLPSPSDIPQDLRVRQTPPSVDDSKFGNKMGQFRPAFNDCPKVFCPQVPLAPRATNLLPPVTVMVPYPIIIPVPLPIPIPIPLTKEDFERLASNSEKTEGTVNKEKEVGKEVILNKGASTEVATKSPRKRKRVLVTKGKTGEVAQKTRNLYRCSNKNAAFLSRTSH